MPRRAVALFSGGLDSLLAVETVRKQGIEVVPVWICTCFQKPYVEMVKKGKDLKQLGAELSERSGFSITVLSVCKEFFHIMQDPPRGFGKNMNPCIDCKIVMLKRAKSYMAETGASFIITGEVLGQRPMSQNRDTLYVIEREAGAEGIVLRPLCAHHLEQTVPENEGWVDREQLFGFRGRGRKPQMALAEGMKIIRYPQPAGGCLLTEPEFAKRVRDVLEYNTSVDEQTAPLCAAGRHFRISDTLKLIIGRDHSENLFLERFRETHTLIIPDGVPGPSGMIAGEFKQEDDKMICCGILARYITKAEGEIVFNIYHLSGDTEQVRTESLPEEEVERMRI